MVCKLIPVPAYVLGVIFEYLPIYDEWRPVPQELAV